MFFGVGLKGKISTVAFSRIQMCTGPAGPHLAARLAQLKMLNACPSASHRKVKRSVRERGCVSPARSTDRDKGRREGGGALLFDRSPSDSNGTFCLSFHGQAASGVDFVRADTEEHDYTQLTAL